MIRLFLMLLMIAASGCSVTGSGGSYVGGGYGPGIQADLDAAFDDYRNGDLDLALLGFQAISADDSAPTKLRREAYLGSALVYLSPDESLHDLRLAGVAVDRASALADATASPDPATDVLATTVMALLTAEAENAELAQTAQSVATEAARLRGERDALRAEQQQLNEALQQLTEMTLDD